MRRPAEIIGSYLELCKPRISLLSTLSSATGFIVAIHDPRPEMIILMIGVFFLACGASALNQYQDRRFDALMTRTEKRPLPSGRIDPLHALYFSLMLIFWGTASLLLIGRILAPALGLGAVFWYNGVYTYLKRRTAFAAVPGALVGSIPPAIGWVAGGGNFQDPKLLTISFFFFMWQIPHFWLLLLNYGEEYKKAGLPCLTDIFTKMQMIRVIFNWIFAAAVSCVFLSVQGVIQTSLINFLIFAASLWLIWNGIRILRKKSDQFLYAFTFRKINIYIFFVMLLLSVDKLFV